MPKSRLQDQLPQATRSASSWLRAAVHLLVLLGALAECPGVDEFLTAEVLVGETGEFCPPQTVKQQGVQVIYGSPLVDTRSANTIESRSPRWVGPPRPLAVWRRDSWQVEQGLPEDEIRALCQTSDGYLWIGTPSGLARFDGQRFVVFNEGNTPALAQMTHDIRRLREDSQGDLWIGTQTSIGRIHRGRWEVVGDSLLTGKARLRDFAFGRDGTVWVGTTQGLMFIRNGEWSTNGTPKSLDGLGVLSVMPAEEGSILTVGAEGLLRWNPETNESALIPTGIPAESMLSGLMPGSSGSFWVASPFVLRRFVGDHVLAWIAPEGDANSASVAQQRMCSDPDGSVWISLGLEARLYHATDGGLEDVLDTQGDPVLRVQAVLRDEEGSIWCGTRGSGLIRLRPQPVRSMMIRQPEGLEEVSSVLEAKDGSIWCGLRSGVGIWSSTGLCLPVFEPYGGFHVKVYSMASSSDDSLIWVGTRGFGLVGLPSPPTLLAPGPAYPVPLLGEHAGNVRASAFPSSRVCWLGSTNGLHRFDGQEWLTFGPAQGLASRDVRCLLWETNDDLWVGTVTGGLARLTLSSQGGTERRFQSWALQEDPSPATVWALHRDRQGVLWIGTSRGLICRQGTRDFYLPLVIPALREGVLQILEDDRGWLWLSGRQGLVRVSREDALALAAGKASPLRWNSLTTLDGMPSSQMGGESQPAGCRASDGRLYFPTARGVAVVDPADPNLILRPPRLLIEEVSAEGELLWTNGQPGSQATDNPLAVPAGTGLLRRVSPHQARDLRIRYTTTSLAAADRVRFEHRLVGLDSSWHPGGIEREARYTNLKPGEYRFEVRAINHQGTPSRESAVWGFVRVAAFHETAAFAVVVALAVLGVASGFTYWRLLWQRRVLRLEQQVALNQERQRIARDMHDDLGAQLSALSLRLSGTTARDARESSEVQQRVREVLQQLHSLIWTVEPGNERLESLLGFVSDFARDYLARAGLQLHLSLPNADATGIQLRPETRRHLVAAVKEALRNVVQHAQATSVSLRIETTPGHVVIEIIDDGQGFHGAQGTREGGLRHLAQRLNDLGGTCQVESSPGHGTKVRLKSPW